MVMQTLLPQGVRLNPRRMFEVCEGMSIQAAINAAAAQVPAPSGTNPWVVLIYPGYYNEQITMASYVSLVGMGPNSTTIYQVDADVFTNIATDAYISNLSIGIYNPTAARRGINVNAATTVLIQNVNFYVVNPGAFAHSFLYVTAAATVTLQRSQSIILGTGNATAVHNLTAPAIVVSEFCRFEVGQNGWCIRSDIAGNMLDVINCSLFGQGAALNCSAGGIHIWGGSLSCHQASAVTGGTAVWKVREQEYHVMRGMVIQHSINAAAADVPAPAANSPYVVKVHAGEYTEKISMASYVSLEGDGPGSTIIQQVSDNVIQTIATDASIRNLTLRMTAPVGVFHLINAAIATTMLLENVTLEVTTPGAIGFRGLAVGAAATITMRRCSAVFGGTGACEIVSNLTTAATITLDGCEFTINSANGFGVSSTIAGNNIRIINCLFHGVGRHIRASAGIVRIYNSQYRSILRSATGNIVDGSPDLKDAPWFVQKWDWMAVLAQSQVAVRGTPVNAGTGQVMLEVTDNVAGQEAVESGTPAAGSLTPSSTPARTPRILIQFMIDAFDPDVTAFFGLRATLGNAVPGAAEAHAGFDWTGAGFRATSSDGAGVGQQTILTTPSTGAQHQLEVIIIGGVQVEFYLDGALVASHANVAGIPAAALWWQHLLATAGAGGGDLVQATVRHGGCQECPS